jgi:riboflavin biosynthesis pyrimidine reductase
MHVVLFAAQSLDGRITCRSEAGDAFASAADKAHFREAIRACDACVMGAATYEQSKERMRPSAFPALRRVVWTRSPTTPERAAETVPGVLEFTAESPSETVARLRADGRRRCAVLGGGQVNAAWLATGLVDEVCVTLESWIFGYGVPLAGAESARSSRNGLPLLPDTVQLELLETRILAPGGPVLLRYSVKK